MHDSDGKAGFWKLKTSLGIVLYIGLWLVSLYLALNYFHHYVAKSDPPSKADKYNILDGARLMVCELELDHARLAWDRLFVRPLDKAGADAAKQAYGKGYPCLLDKQIVSGERVSVQAIVAPPAATEAGSSLPATLATVLEEIRDLGESVKNRTHPPQLLPDSLLKVLVVIAISWLWFHTFLLANELKRALSRWRHHRVPFDTARFREAQEQTLADNRLRVVLPPATAPRWREHRFFNWAPLMLKWVLGLLSLVPALVFAIAMHSVYEPAVFVMALAAIFVAAEHYGGLTETEHELKARTDDLKAKMGTVLDADGLNEWRTELYGLYAKASYRVDAVIRYFDIDAIWWKCAGAADPWIEYQARCARSSGADTLLSTLIRTEAKVRFVSDQDLDVLERLPRASREERKGFFRALLGLAWNLVVFDIAYDAHVTNVNKGKVTRFRIKISRAPCWMHVVDETVFQAIERGPENATVRQLTHDISDPDDRRALSGWARDNVQRFAQRGGRAEEYVFAVLRYAALGLRCQEEEELPLRRLLNQLGMKNYLDEPKQDFLLAAFDVVDERMNRSVLLSRETAETLCTAVFSELLKRRLGKHTCFVKSWTTPGCTKLKHLLSELV